MMVVSPSCKLVEYRNVGFHVLSVNLGSVRQSIKTGVSTSAGMNKRGLMGRFAGMTKFG